MIFSELTNVFQNLCHDGMANKVVIVNGVKVENITVVKKGDTVEVKLA